MTGTLPRGALALCLAVVVAATLAVGCSGNSDDASTEVNVVTTLPLFADIVAEIAGDRAAVDSLLPPGADPHAFEPSPSDVRKITEADVIFANGLGLEPSLLRVIGANISSGAVLVELAEAVIGAGVPTLAPDDPHLWMDPANGREYAAIIRDTLILQDPGGSDTYSGNYETYAATLDDTAQYMRDTAAAVPPDDRLIIATHDAFGYLARAVDFEIAGFVVPGPGQDASPEDISELITTIGDLGIPAVFTEPQTSVETRTLEQIASDAGVKVCELYSDALDDAVRTYIELLRFNAEELARCLGGGGD
ncbi:MAG: zinc ABC transporter substrate-binding protein [Chloroflexi bacterium]|nr:zinc ABC transporter substrate-binding protein [Chloroflexota bacterium]